MERNTEQWTVSLPPLLSKRALRLAREESRTRSELVREALRSYMERRERFRQMRVRLAKSLEAKGIRTLEDMERMIDEGRA